MHPVDQSNAQHYKWGDICDGWRLLDLPHFSVIQERVPVGGGELAHLHNEAHQFFYILSGRATLELAAESVSLGPGQGCYVAPGVVHRFVNESDRDVTFLVISAPSTKHDRDDRVEADANA